MATVAVPTLKARSRVLRRSRSFLDVELGTRRYIGYEVSRPILRRCRTPRWQAVKIAGRVEKVLFDVRSGYGPDPDDPDGHGAHLRLVLQHLFDLPCGTTDADVLARLGELLDELDQARLVHEMITAVELDTEADGEPDPAPGTRRRDRHRVRAAPGALVRACPRRLHAPPLGAGPTRSPVSRA